MSEAYETVAVQPDGLAPRDAILRVHKLLDRWDIRIIEDSLLVLHGTNDRDPEVVPISDPNDALERVIQWPTLGTIDYGGPEAFVAVSFLGDSGPLGLQGVLIAAQQRSVDQSDGLPRYRKLSIDLHKSLPARRTVMEWGLEAQGFRWEDEVRRLCEGKFEGVYPLLDLQRQ